MMSTDEQQTEEQRRDERGEKHELVHAAGVPLGQLDETPRSDIAILLSQAIQIPDFDVTKFNELMTMMREHEEIARKQRAQEAYLKAKSKFLGSCPVINADKRADKFNYPSYGKILEVCLPLMSKVGLSHTTTPDFEAKIVTCVMKHTLGHEESATFPMTIEGQPSTGNFKLSLQQQWAFALTYAERQSFKAVSGVPTSDSDVDMLPSAEPQGGAKERVDPLARTATKIEFDNLTAGWWKWAQPTPVPGTALYEDQVKAREEFTSLDKLELQELFMAWVMRSIDGVQAGFVKEESPHTFFTVRQITDLWAIINDKGKERKVDANTDTKEERRDSN